MSLVYSDSAFRESSTERFRIAACQSPRRRIWYLGPHQFFLNLKQETHERCYPIFSLELVSLFVLFPFPWPYILSRQHCGDINQLHAAERPSDSSEQM
jgi:hypothetical protein